MNWNDSSACDDAPQWSRDDGFVRLSLDFLLCLRLEHLLTGLDLDPPGMRRCGSSTAICGFSEWTSCGRPRLSLGWDWRLAWELRPTALVRVGLPNSNVMLVDRKGIDYGWQRNLEVLATVVDALPWRESVHGALARCTL